MISFHQLTTSRNIVLQMNHICLKTKGIESGFYIIFKLLGEAAANLSNEIKERYFEVPWYKIIAMRNYLVHEYFGINLFLIKDTVMKIIPEFKEQILNIIKDF